VYRGPGVYRGPPEVYRGPCMKNMAWNSYITYTNVYFKCMIRISEFLRWISERQKIRRQIQLSAPAWVQSQAYKMILAVPVLNIMNVMNHHFFTANFSQKCFHSLYSPFANILHIHVAYIVLKRFCSSAICWRCIICFSVLYTIAQTRCHGSVFLRPTQTQSSPSVYNPTHIYGPYPSHPLHLIYIWQYPIDKIKFTRYICPSNEMQVNFTVFW